MTDLQARAEAAADAVGEAIQKAWDVCPTLPAIDLDEAERTALGKAAAMAALQSEGWRPISEAPRDGTEFQAWVGNWEPRCRFNPESEAFEIWGRVDYDEDGWDTYGHLTPTHFMPLPAPPEGEGN